MRRHLSSLDPNNLRVLFGASDFLRDLSDDLREDLSIGRVLARTVIAPKAHDPIRAGEVFAPKRRLSVPCLAGKRVGLVASGGSGALASLCGVKRALEEAGVEVSAIAACSGAMLFASLWAAGLEAEAMADLWLGLDTRDYVDPDWRALAAGALHRFRGLAGVIAGRAVQETFEARFPGLYAGALKIPLASVAWNIDANTIEEIGTMATPGLTLGELVRIAVALPPFVQPVSIGGRVLADGGVVDIFPVEALLHLGERLDVVIGVNAYHPRDFAGEHVDGWLEAPWSIFEATRQLRTSVHLELARARMKELGDALIMLHPVPYEEVRGAKFYEAFLDRTRWPDFMRAGYFSARRRLEALAHDGEPALPWLRGGDAQGRVPWAQVASGARP